MRQLDLEVVVGAIAIAVIVAAILSLALNYVYPREPSGDWSKWRQLVSSIAGGEIKRIVYEREYDVNGSISLHAIVSNGGLVVFDNKSTSNKLTVVVVEKSVWRESKAYFINVSSSIVDVRVDGYTLYLYVPKGSITSIDCNSANSGLLVNLSDSRSLHYFSVNMVNGGSKILLWGLANTSIGLNSTTSGVEMILYYDQSGNRTYSSIDARFGESGAKIDVVAPGYAFNISFDSSMSGARIVVDNESFGATGKWFYVSDDYGSSSKRIDIRLYAYMSGVKLWVKRKQ